MDAGRRTTRPRALVTGASAGIGQAFSERLARDGYDLVVIGRRADRLAQLADRLQDGPGVTVETLVADLSRPADVQALAERIAREPALDLLVNNAGATWIQPFIESDPDDLEALLRLHTVTVMRLTRAALPAMLARGQGAIINVSSAAIFFPEPDYYCATKTFAEAFTRALHEEVRETGVRLQALCPGFTRTEIFDRLGYPADDVPASAWMAADAVVQASLTALQLGELVCLPSVEDAGLLARLREDQQRIIDDGMIGTLAHRYAPPGS
jgi:uncharacterized protein